MPFLKEGTRFHIHTSTPPTHSVASTKSPSKLSAGSALRVVVATLAIAGCFWAIWFAGKLSLTRILVQYGMGVRNVAAVSEAVRLGPVDAEAYFARAAVQKSYGLTSLPDFESAVALRPRDYYLWMELGMAREEHNDPGGALAAFNESVRLAPFYARPLWQRGNLLLRLKRFDEAFVDLRSAAKSDPDLVSNLIDLSWNLSQLDVRKAEQLGGLNTPELHIAFARYLARRNQPVAALEQIALAGHLPEKDKRELIGLLIATGAFAEANLIWRGAGSDNAASFYDGGFESALSLDESGFGWRVSRYRNGSELSLDVNEPESGSQSLRIEFTGNSTPDQHVVAQVLTVEPITTYQISFAARTKDIVTGGLPLIRVTDAAGDSKMLGESTPLSQGTNNWQRAGFTFQTGSTTKAVIASLVRQNCSTSPCPAFGAVWLDSFSVTKMHQVTVKNPG